MVAYGLVGNRLSLLIIVKNALVTPQYQGRFLFPSRGVLSLLMVAGWYTFLSSRVQPTLPYMIIALHIGLNFLLWFTRVIPIYYQPFWDVCEICGRILF